MRLGSDRLLTFLKRNLGLHTKSGMFVLILTSISWATMVVFVITGIYNASWKHVVLYTLKMIAMYLLISTTSTCVKFGGCHRYSQMLTLSSISMSVLFVMTI